jgi:hypothetical protein
MKENQQTDKTSEAICAPNVIEKLIFNQFKDIMNTNTFNNDKTIQPNITTLINNISNDANPNIDSFILSHFSEYLHNRVGTLLLKSERENIPLFSNFSFKKGALIIWQSRDDEFQWVIYLKNITSTTFHHTIITDNRGNRATVHQNSLFIYPPSEPILPSSTVTMKYDETHIFETYNLDNIK